jgi:hypothetical protein
MWRVLHLIDQGRISQAKMLRAPNTREFSGLLVLGLFLLVPCSNLISQESGRAFDGSWDLPLEGTPRNLPS